MEFVGSVLLSVAECLENFGNSGRDPADESPGRWAAGDFSQRTGSHGPLNRFDLQPLRNVQFLW